MKAIAGHPIAVGFLTFIVSRIGLSPFVGVQVCSDGWHSMSIGRRGACSWHGGVGGLDHGNWVMPAAIALGLVAGFAWSGLRSKWQERADPVEEWRPLRVPSPPVAASPPEPHVLSNEDTAPGLQSVSRQVAWLRCPKCASAMKLRTARQGRYAGREFWGCSRYPSCNEIVNIKSSVATWSRSAGARPTSSLPDGPVSVLPSEELEQLRERTRRATEKSAAYIAAELARAKMRRSRIKRRRR